MITFLFPGQGSQRVGMGKRLCGVSAAGRRVYEEAAEVLGFDLLRLCQEGPMEILTATQNAQPAIIATSAAYLAMLAEQGVEPDMVAGHSVGEFAALIAAGSLTLRDALLAVRMRGELMASVRTPGGMAAITGLSAERVEGLCAENRQGEVLQVALYNDGRQIVVTGSQSAVARLCTVALAAGASDVVPLKVSQAFHSPLMSEILPAWQDYVTSLPLGSPRCMLVSNLTGQQVQSTDEIRRSLTEQLTCPVKWWHAVHTMVRLGTTKFLEVGDSRVVTAFVRRISPESVVGGMDQYLSARTAVVGYTL